MRSNLLSAGGRLLRQNQPRSDGRSTGAPLRPMCCNGIASQQNRTAVSDLETAVVWRPSGQRTFILTPRLAQVFYFVKGVARILRLEATATPSPCGRGAGGEVEPLHQPTLSLIPNPSPTGRRECLYFTQSHRDTETPRNLCALRAFVSLWLFFTQSLQETFVVFVI